MPPFFVQKSFVPGKIVEYPKPKAIQVGGYVVLDYDAEIEVSSES